MLVLTSVLLLVAAVKVWSVDLSNGLALTPPMGWDSWNMFGEFINETLVVETMDAMERYGLRDAGFVYINLDDGWQHYRSNRNTHPLEADPVKFPNGIKWLADRAHSHGFKLGLYGSPGQTTCSGFTGSEGKEMEDAALYASWGVDHLKYDSCCSHYYSTKAQVQKAILDMSTALLNQTRPIVYHACHCGWQDIWEWAGAMGANHYRIGHDISDDFNYPGGLREGYYYDVLEMIDRGNNLTKYSGPGRWNDYDMLIVNLNGRSTQLVGVGASNIEYRSHFSLWAMVASPLLIGSDVRQLDNYTVETLTNKEVIAVNQDPLGNAAIKVADVNGTFQAYAKNMSDGSIAVALLNRGTTTAVMGAIPWISTPQWNLTWPKYRIRDLWLHKEFGPLNTTYWVEVQSHETKVYRLWEVK